MIKRLTMTEKHYTIQELAELWGLSVRTMRRWFMNELGVLRVSGGKQVTMRIPESIAERVYERHVYQTDWSRKQKIK